MVKMTIDYEGDLHCRLTHLPSGTKISTDAPKDNMGKGESFSPTDLVSSALGACMMTLMGIFAKRHSIELTGTKVTVQKEMTDAPRRIKRIEVVIEMAAGISKNHRPALETAALTCPVRKSIHPDIEVPVKFIYPD